MALEGLLIAIFLFIVKCVVYGVAALALDIVSLGFNATLLYIVISWVLDCIDCYAARSYLAAANSRKHKDTKVRRHWN
jgi:hypothetical protein